MEVEEAVHRLRVIRHFTSEPLAAADLRAILQSGRHTGSSKNLQRWQFIVVRDRERLALLASVGPFAGHIAGAAVAIRPRHARSPWRRHHPLTPPGDMTAAFPADPRVA